MLDYWNLLHMIALRTQLRDARCDLAELRSRNSRLFYLSHNRRTTDPRQSILGSAYLMQVRLHLETEMEDGAGGN